MVVIYFAVKSKKYLLFYVVAYIAPSVKWPMAAEDKMNLIKELEQEQIRKDIPAFRAGDTLRVSVKVKEGEKERIQQFEGVCIARNHGGLQETITVRKVSYGVGVERIFPINAPAVAKIDVINRGKVRRAKLYYLRDLAGKAARIKDRDLR